MLFAALLFVSTMGLLYLLESSLLVEVPARGGTLSEGLIGAPRFINPILAASDTDRDLTMLTYSGLLRATPEGGYLPDLASGYEVSADGTVYTFTMRDGVTFHDGEPVTVEDVAFTIAKATDGTLKSPLHANWDGVRTEVEGNMVRFTLKSPYAPFLGNLTLGILPKHLWGSVSAEEFPFSELNTSPIGSGPFAMGAVNRTASGIPSSYTLKGFGNYALGAPNLSRLVLRFYQSESALLQALKNGDVEAGSMLSPSSLGSLSARVVTAPQGRVFGVFFNQNQSEVLRDKNVRAALNAAIDRNTLVEEVLGGYAEELSEPAPPTLFDKLSETPSTSGNTPEAARSALEQNGWVEGEDGILQKTSGTGSKKKTTRLAFSIATVDAPELRAATEFVREAWTQMGAAVDVEVFAQSDLAQNIIRPRKYDALLFGQVVGRGADLFAFWHSSQRNDPGLNVALYTNQTADAALEALRKSSVDEREQFYRQFLHEIERDLPAVFLYTPHFVYTVPNDLRGLQLGLIEQSSDRFLSVSQWHRETDYVWPFLVRQ